jgi:hypothetical protein
MQNLLHINDSMLFVLSNLSYMLYVTPRTEHYHFMFCYTIQLKALATKYPCTRSPRALLVDLRWLASWLLLPGRSIKQVGT